LEFLACFKVEKDRSVRPKLFHNVLFRHASVVPRPDVISVINLSSGLAIFERTAAIEVRLLLIRRA